MPPPPSPRLIFRTWTNQDTANAESLWCDPEVTHYFGGPKTPEEIQIRLQTEQATQARLGIQYWPIHLRQTGQFAGCAGLRPWSIDPAETEAGVNLMRHAWGQRLGEEALQSVLSYAFTTLNLPKVVTGHAIHHTNSQKLAERTGFTYTHNILWGLKQIEVRMYSITAQSWSTTSQST